MTKYEKSKRAAFNSKGKCVYPDCFNCGLPDCTRSDFKTADEKDALNLKQRYERS